MTLSTEVGPDGLGQLASEVIPFTLIVQPANPIPFVGAVPPDGPATVAVKVIDPPKGEVPAFALTTTEGVYLEMVVAELVLTVTEL